MKKQVKKAVVYLMSVTLMSSAFTVVPGTPYSIEAEAHSGRTDANGGHKDNKNKSGLGSYHYHCGGYPAHLHPDGVCPYKTGSSSGSNTGNSSTAKNETVKETPAETQPETRTEPQAVAAGWKQDSNGWQYCTGDNQCYKNGWQMIDDKWYYFDSNGYMKTGWLEIGEDWYYLASDGHMVTGETEIEGTAYYFEADGKLSE